MVCHFAFSVQTEKINPEGEKSVAGPPPVQLAFFGLQIF